MALNSSGPISLGGTTTGQSIAKEVGGSGTSQIALNDSNVRSLAGVSSGQIVMPTNFWGKSTSFTFNKTISTNTLYYNLLSDMLANGYTNGSAYTVNITIASGVYVWSDSSTPAFDTGAITGTGTINLINNGYIMGRGGNAGDNYLNQAGQPGNTAMNIQKSINITNNSYIGGGGGGGSGSGGGGAGGGRGGGSPGWNPSVTAAGGAVGQVGETILIDRYFGGGGGRIMPGTGGIGAYKGVGTNNLNGNGGGAGGGGGAGDDGKNIYPGGDGGSAGNAGQTDTASGGGGGWGASGGNGGGAGGKCVNLNGNTVTWIVTGTRYGAIS